MFLSVNLKHSFNSCEHFEWKSYELVYELFILVGKTKICREIGCLILATCLHFEGMSIPISTDTVTLVFLRGSSQGLPSLVCQLHMQPSKKFDTYFFKTFIP